MKAEDKIENCSFCGRIIKIELENFDVSEQDGNYIYRCEECK